MATGMVTPAVDTVEVDVNLLLGTVEEATGTMCT
jgi:hypothetical protein